MFNKIRYVEYTDRTFTVKKAQPSWLGVLGPVIRAEVGDTLLVNFCNISNSGNAYGTHQHGVNTTKPAKVRITGD